MLDAQGDAYADLAEVLALTGRPQEAALALEQALERYQRKGNLVSTQQSQIATRRAPTHSGVVKAVRPAETQSRITAQGSPQTIYRRAIERGNLLVAETTTPRVPRVTLVERLAPDRADAQKDPRRRHARVAARWLPRWLDASDDATIYDVALAASVLQALWTLRAMAEEATGRGQHPATARSSSGICHHSFFRGRSDGPANEPSWWRGHEGDDLPVLRTRA